MSVPEDGSFQFVPTARKGSKDQPKTITVPSLAKIPRSFDMIEAAADGSDAKFIVNALRNVDDAEMLAALRALVPSDWERFINEWQKFSRIAAGE